MTGFYGLTDEWKKPRDHNHLRITRIIRCLTLVGQKEYARRFHDFVVANSPLVPLDVKWYWREALNENPEWLVR